MGILNFLLTKSARQILFLVEGGRTYASLGTILTYKYNFYQDERRIISALLLLFHVVVVVVIFNQ